MDFKFLHAADFHLDSPLRGLSRYEGVPADIRRIGFACEPVRSERKAACAPH